MPEETKADIHLWYLHTEDFLTQAAREYCNAVISPEEIQRAERFRLPEHRQRFVLTRGLVRAVLSHHCEDVSPAHWCFTTNAHGKPFIDLPALSPQLSFNVSHSGQRIAVAVTEAADIGMDVETVNGQRSIEKIAHRFFAETEYLDLKHLPTDNQVDRFYNIWTLKESYIKALGVGMSLSLGNFAFELDDALPLVPRLDPVSQQQASDNDMAWQFWLYNDVAGYRLAIASRSRKNDSAHSLYVNRLTGFFEPGQAGLVPLGQSGP